MVKKIQSYPILLEILRTVHLRARQKKLEDSTAEPSNCFVYDILSDALLCSAFRPNDNRREEGENDRGGYAGARQLKYTGNDTNPSIFSQRG